MYCASQETVNEKFSVTDHPNLALLQPDSNNYKGKVYVLTKERSFSASAEFSSIVKTNNRGKFIGEECGGGYNPNASIANGNGGTVHLFTELPALLHYNFGLGSSDQTPKRTGFYIGGGANYIMTGFTDTAGFFRETSFFGWVVDGGIRFKKIMDMNFANVFSLRQPIGQIKHPMFFEITFSLQLKPVIY